MINPYITAQAMRNSLPNHPRLIDIAQLAGVSKGTVARVLNDAGKSTIRVSDKTRQSILAIARELHYTPNYAAQTLMGKSTRKLGVLIDSRAPRCIYRCLCAFEDAAVQAGYRLMIGRAHDDPQSLFQCYDNFVRHGIDGVACLAHDYPRHAAQIQDFFQVKTNIVYYDPPTWNAPHVNVDRKTGILQAITHLREGGHGKIGLWLPLCQDYYSFRQRLETYRSAEDDSLCIRDNTPEDAVRHILSKGMDAIICSNDILAAQLIRQLVLRQIRVPQDLAVVGHDNDDFSSFFLPSITTIDQHDQTIGKQLFDLLIQHLHHTAPERRNSVETSLIIRESTQSMTAAYADCHELEPKRKKTLTQDKKLFDSLISQSKIM